MGVTEKKRKTKNNTQYGNNVTRSRKQVFHVLYFFIRMMFLFYSNTMNILIAFQQKFSIYSINVIYSLYLMKNEIYVVNQHEIILEIFLTYWSKSLAVLIKLKCFLLKKTYLPFLSI